jgi:hypothetical protein
MASGWSCSATRTPLFRNSPERGSSSKGPNRYGPVVCGAVVGMVYGASQSNA